MFKRILLGLALALGAVGAGIALPNVAVADDDDWDDDWDDDDHYWGHGRHWNHGHHGHWHGHHHGHHGHWRRPIVYPPIYVGGYYPVRTYYAAPYYPYGYYGYYGSGVSLSVGW